MEAKTSGDDRVFQLEFATLSSRVDVGNVKGDVGDGLVHSEHGKVVAAHFVTWKGYKGYRGGWSVNSFRLK